MMELEAMDASQSESILNRFNADAKEDVATQCAGPVEAYEAEVEEGLPRPWKKTPGAGAEVTESPMEDTEAVPLCGWGMATTLLLLLVAAVAADAQSLDTIPVAVKELSAVVAVAAEETES